MLEIVRKIGSKETFFKMNVQNKKERKKFNFPMTDCKNADIFQVHRFNVKEGVGGGIVI